MAATQKSLTGTVVSDKMDKTVVVLVQRITHHRLYRKAIKRSKRFLAHDDRFDAKQGDLVRILETRPQSRHKRWRVSEILKRGEVAEVAPREIDSEYFGRPREREAEPAAKPPPAVEAPTAEAATETPVAEAHTAEAATETPVVEAPTAEAATEAPAAEAPEAEAAAETPAAEAPEAKAAAEAPAAEASTAEAATETPAAEPPEAEAAAEAPAEEAPEAEAAAEAPAAEAPEAEAAPAETEDPPKEREES